MIDEDLDEIGIMLTTTKDEQVAIDNGVREFPAIGLFRNGQFIQVFRVILFYGLVKVGWRSQCPTLPNP